MCELFVGNILIVQIFFEIYCLLTNFETIFVELAFQNYLLCRTVHKLREFGPTGSYINCHNFYMDESTRHIALSNLITATMQYFII